MPLSKFSVRKPCGSSDAATKIFYVTLQSYVSPGSLCKKISIVVALSLLATESVLLCEEHYSISSDLYKINCDFCATLLNYL